MALTRFAINRPVAIAMLIAALVLMGVVAHGKLNVQLLPKIDSAAVTVITTYNGATAEDMEQLVTKQIEDAVATLGSLDYISSSSKEGVSQVLVVFLDNVSADLAPSDVSCYENRASDVRPGSAR